MPFLRKLLRDILQQNERKKPRREKHGIQEPARI
jgi:hypothetical protein